MEAAVKFGADAVYLAHEKFNMRTGAQNFDDNGLRSAVEYVHGAGVKVYITLNTMPHNDEIKEVPQVIETAADARRRCVYCIRCRRFCPLQEICGKYGYTYICSGRHSKFRIGEDVVTTLAQHVRC